MTKKELPMKTNLLQNATFFDEKQILFSSDRHDEQLLINTSPVSNKKVTISFEGEMISSDAGVLLLKEIEKQIGIIGSIAAVIPDDRDYRYVRHDLVRMLKQRIFQIACGYEDANDCDSLREDPIFKLCADRLPSADVQLASQPTMTRLENSISMKTNYLIAKALADRFIASYSKEPKVIVLDFDDTDDTVHGNQQLALFNGYFNEYCYMPLHVYEGLSGNLITTILKPGKRLKGKAVLAILKRIIALIRKQWKNTLIIFRGDSHFASPEIMRFIEENERLKYITGYTGYTTLDVEMETTVNSAKKLYQRTKRPVKLYHSFYHKADSWDKPQRIIGKVEVSEKGVNIRFIVTNCLEAKAKSLYEDVYCKRGCMELFIKNHKTYLKSDRTSCHTFKANQFRLLLHSVAYILIHSMQKEFLRDTEFASANMDTIQLKIFKIGARIRELKTKIHIILPISFPNKKTLFTAFAIWEALRC
jgi:hypothetical protein